MSNPYFRVFFAIVMSAMGAGQASAFAPDYGKGKSAAARILALFDSEPSINTFSEKGDTIVSKTIAQVPSIIVIFPKYLRSTGTHIVCNKEVQYHIHICVFPCSHLHIWLSIYVLFSYVLIYVFSKCIDCRLRS